MTEYKKCIASSKPDGKLRACFDCGFAPDAPMLHDDLWAQISPDKINKGGGLLCGDCVENRLGRRLTRDDLNQSLMTMCILWMAKRLTND